MLITGWISCFLHGILQSILLWAPLIQPLREDPIPNVWFYPCEIYEMWAFLLDADSRPTEEFMDSYWECFWSKFRGGIVDQYLTTLGNRLRAVWNTIGSLPEGVGSVAEWLGGVWYRVGDRFLEFADNLTEGVEMLWELIPEPIREGLQTWAEFLSIAPELIQDWVEEHFGWVRDWLVILWDWFGDIGEILTDWWLWARETLEEIIENSYSWLSDTIGGALEWLIWFFDDPVGALITLLSPWLGQLITFASDCLDFWYNIWGSFAEDLAELLENPLDFLWDRAEAYLNEKLG